MGVSKGDTRSLDYSSYMRCHERVEAVQCILSSFHPAFHVHNVPQWEHLKC